MKIISTVHKLLFFKITDLNTLDAKIWKKKIKFIIKVKKYHQLRIRSEIFIRLKIILIAFNV